MDMRSQKILAVQELTYFVRPLSKEQGRFCAGQIAFTFAIWHSHTFGKQYAATNTFRTNVLTSDLHLLVLIKFPKVSLVRSHIDVE